MEKRLMSGNMSINLQKEVGTVTQNIHLAHQTQIPGFDQEQQRLQALAESGLLEVDNVPIFQEATQTAAHFLNVPICILGIINRDRQWLKASSGLSKLGLMNDLVTSRYLARYDAFCSRVVEQRQSFSLADTTRDPVLKHSLLTEKYGVKAYLGAPLLDKQGHCLGTLAVWELQPREFSDKERAFLEMMARWCMSEFERDRLANALVNVESSPMATVINGQENRANSPLSEPSSPTPEPLLAEVSLIKAQLITQMTQELCTPLTSVLGMTSMLRREIYGPLTDKQKEYMDIVHHSGQYLLSLVNEVVELGALDDITQAMDLAPVDVEMLCQQALGTLKQAADRRELTVELTVEPGNRISLLDKNKVRQLLYHLVFSVIQTSNADSTIRIHISRRSKNLQLTVWTSHPWFGDGLPATGLENNPLLAQNQPDSSEPLLDDTSALRYDSALRSHPAVLGQAETTGLSSDAAVDLGSANAANMDNSAPPIQQSRQYLGLQLSRQLAKMHGGDLTLQGASATGYRYVVSLPQLATPTSDG